MNTQNQKEALQNAANKLGLFVHVKQETDKRKKKRQCFF